MTRDGATDGPVFWNATWRKFYDLERLRKQRRVELERAGLRKLLSGFNVGCSCVGKAPTCWSEAPTGMANLMGDSDVFALCETLFVSPRLAGALRGLFQEIDRTIEAEFLAIPQPGPYGLLFEQVNEFVTRCEKATQ